MVNNMAALIGVNDSTRNFAQGATSEEESLEPVLCLPEDIRLNIFTYCEEIAPTELLGRVEYHPSLNPTHTEICFFFDEYRYGELFKKGRKYARGLGIPFSINIGLYTAARQKATEACIRVEIPVQLTSPSRANICQEIQPLAIDGSPYFYDVQQLHRSAEDFYATATLPAPLDLSSIPDHLSVEELLTRLLTQYNGLLIGELHAESVARYLIIKFLPLFVKLGVDTIFIEGVGEEQYSGILERYLAEPVEWENLAPVWTDVSVFVKAKMAGIKRIVCLDTDASLSLPSWRDNKGNARVMGGNFQWKRVIEKTAGAGKWIGFCGASHNGTANGVAGLGQLLQIPSVWPVDVTNINSLKPSTEMTVVRQFKHYAEQRSIQSDFAILMSPSSVLPES